MMKLYPLLLLLFLVACQIENSDNVTYVVGTPVAGTLSNNVVDQVGSQPPPPTAMPYVDPSVALQIGDRYLIDGYYENAVSTFQEILMQQEAVPEIRAAAAYSMAQAALREGLFQDAVDATTILIDQFSSDFRAIQAYFLRGDAYLGLSQWEAAIDDFQRYLSLRAGLIDSYAYERIADAELALNRYDVAIGHYNQALAAQRLLLPQLQLREKVARLHLLKGQVEEAVAQYDAILEAAQNEAYRAEIEFAAAQAFLETGDSQRGLARMRRIFLVYEEQIQAYNALLLLEAHGQQELNTYQKARVYYFNGDYDSAIGAFNEYTTQAPLTEIPAELHLLLGRAYRAIGNNDAALIAFQTLVERHPTDPLFGDALLEQGRTRFLADDLEGAIAKYLELAGTYNYLADMAAEATWRAGYLHGTLENYAESRRIFEQLAANYPQSEWASSGLFIAASAALNSGDRASAEQLYSQLAAVTTGEEQASAYLQVGQLALERGDQTAAVNALNQAVAAAPDTYYAARAQDILVGRAPFTVPDQYVFAFDDLANVTEAEDWIRSTFGVVQEGPLWPLPLELEAEPRIVRGRELWAVGAFADAEDEFYDVLEDYELDGLASYQLAIFFRILGSYTPSMQGAANMITAAGLSTVQAPAYIARMRYPLFYLETLQRIAQEYDLDPLLLASLIRHESLFNTNATGGAGEKGLTQVIPSTGEYIAEQINWPDYQHRDLFRPHAGIEFGAYYLSEQMQRFNRNPYAALAGYNAGPGRSQQWLQLSGGAPDAFMSTITIESVQRYIQRIYRNYNIYRTLYGKGKTNRGI